jgi:molybdopterin/thiamine biosynthesis adenylyltransferase
MLDRNKVLEFFDAATLKAPIHIIGCGAIGSHVAERLVRMGCEDIHLWDFDEVSPHNITNQMFIEDDIGRCKIDAILDMLYEINSDLMIPGAERIKLHGAGWKDELLSGYVFLCVDNIDLRRAIVEKNQYNPNCIAFFDFRMRLTDAQHYMAPCQDADRMKKLLASMDFSHAEAKDATPKSACNIELSVCYTVSSIVSFGIANFVNLCLNKPTKDMILVDMNRMIVDAFPMN